MREMAYRILVADVEEMDDRYAAALAGLPLDFARTMDEAREALATHRYDLVVVGVYFDDSQVFGLVRTIRADEFNNEAPIICVRGRPGFTAVPTRTLESAVKALTADDFVDFLHFVDDRSGDSALRAPAGRFVKS